MKAQAIYEALVRLQEKGVVRDDLMIYSPDGRGRRYVLAAGGKERSYEKREVEAFIHGAEAALNLTPKEWHDGDEDTSTDPLDRAGRAGAAARNDP